MALMTRSKSGCRPLLATIAALLGAVLGMGMSRGFTYCKRPQNPFMHFAAEQRSNYEEEGKPAREVMKDIGEAWRALTAAKKKKYLTLAAEDKERYRQDLAEGLEPAPRKSKKHKKVKKVKKERKSGPKKALTPYFAYCKEMFAKRGRGVSASKMAKRNGTGWRKLTAKAKLEYKKLAEEDQARFKKELEAVEASR